jgi:hypothetical protein
MTHLYPGGTPKKVNSYTTRRDATPLGQVTKGACGVVAGLDDLHRFGVDRVEQVRVPVAVLPVAAYR